jgi:glycosyltransferase involved in cell wall biosynthesis
MSKDVIIDRYARLYEIPHQLAKLGHLVYGYCLSYQNAPKGLWIHETNPGQLIWKSYPIWPNGLNYWPTMLRELSAFQPNLIIGASDIPHVALAAQLSRKLDVPYLIDLYDNFEGFGQARIPGMKKLLRNAVHTAPLVTTTSQALADFVLESYKAKGTVLSMPSTIDHNTFYKQNQTQCRKSLGLPIDAKLIGTAGGLYADKGIDTLYSTWKRLATQYDNLHLVLAGPTDPNCRPPNHERVHYLGLLPHHQIATLFNSLNVGIIYLRDTVFGRYCFPQKAYEMAACGTPIVAGHVGAMRNLLANIEEALYQPDNIHDLIRAITFQLHNPQRIDIPIEDWESLIRQLNRTILTKFSF